jgi:ABC-2 type transport system ATP-binding protein
VLELDGLRKRYGDRRALDGLSFRARAGRLCGFLGANGAGKTTAMRCVFGIVHPDAGRITWRGKPVGPAERIRFGYLPEQRGLYPRMRLADQLTYQGRLHGMTRSAAEAAAARLLDELGLADRAADRVEALSHGNQQRVQLAAALVHDPELLVLDEPFSGLDPLGVESMAGLLRARTEAGAAVVFSSHQLDLVEDRCDDVVLIDQGRLLLDGPLDEVRARAGTRVVEVTFAEPTAWCPAATSAPPPPAATMTVPADADHEAMVASARAAGTVTGFTFRPPTLAEIFRSAVRREPGR